MRIRPTVAATALAIAVLAPACSSSNTSGNSTLVPAHTVQTSATVVATTPTSTAVFPTTSTAVTTTGAPSTTSTTSPPAPPTTVAGAVDPNAPEVVEPGDIPDNQVFIPFTPTVGVYTVKVPEGWARTESGGVVTFTDKYNSIRLETSSATTAPTVESVKAEGLKDVASDPTFTLNDVTTVPRKAGTVVLATYEVGSAPNAVTGKKALLAVERYVFFHNGTVVTMTLSGAKGADNVDPWRTVSDSLAWS